MICILHKEMDAHLTAEGIYANFGIPEDVHLRRRSPKKVVQSIMASNAPTTFWQVRGEGRTRRGKRDATRRKRWGQAMANADHTRKGTLAREGNWKCVCVGDSTWTTGSIISCPPTPGDPTQIELDGGQTIDMTGDVVIWEQPILLRHMITRKYLSVVESRGVTTPTLVDVNNDQDRVRKRDTQKAKTRECGPHRPSSAHPRPWSRRLSLLSRQDTGNAGRIDRHPHTPVHGRDVLPVDPHPRILFSVRGRDVLPSFPPSFFYVCTEARTVPDLPCAEGGPGSAAGQLWPHPARPVRPLAQ